MIYRKMFHFAYTLRDNQRVRSMYLSRATLVIITLNQLNQWYLETNKYCDEVLCVNSDLIHK